MGIMAQSLTETKDLCITSKCAADSVDRSVLSLYFGSFPAMARLKPPAKSEIGRHTIILFSYGDTASLDNRDIVGAVDIIKLGK